MKGSIFWDITQCSPLKVNRCYGGTYSLHLQGRISRAWNQSNSSWQENTRWFLARLIPQTWRWRRYVPPKRRLTSNGLHDVISQKIVLFTPIFSLLSLFWKNRVHLWDHVAVCVCLCIPPPIKFWTLEPIFMKLGTYITEPELIWMA
jgi:hypothetical protein